MTRDYHFERIEWLGGTIYTHGFRLSVQTGIFDTTHVAACKVAAVGGIRGPFPATLTIPDYATAELLLEAVNQLRLDSKAHFGEFMRALRASGPPEPGDDAELARLRARRDKLESLMIAAADAVGDDS